MYATVITNQSKDVRDAKTDKNQRQLDAVLKRLRDAQNEEALKRRRQNELNRI